jgi:chloride channel protein, CIC family
VVDAEGLLTGLVTRRDLIDHVHPATLRVREIVRRKPVVVYEDNSLREAADHMVREEVGRVAVVSRARPLRVIGILSRSDLLMAHERRLRRARHAERHIQVTTLGPGGRFFRLFGR